MRFGPPSFQGTFFRTVPSFLIGPRLRMNFTVVDSTTRSAGSRKEPRRTCVVCQKEDAPSELVRFVRSPEGEVFPDLKASSFGRGAWAHPAPGCLKKLPNALARSFRAEVVTSPKDVVERLALAADARVRQLLGAARRQRLITVGADAASEAWFSGKAEMLLVASDARAAAELASVRAAVPLGKVRVWGTKDELGQLTGRPEVGVLAVSDQRLATGLFGAIAMALLAHPTTNAPHVLVPREGQTSTSDSSGADGPRIIVSTEDE